MSYGDCFNHQKQWIEEDEDSHKKMSILTHHCCVTCVRGMAVDVFAKLKINNSSNIDDDQLIKPAIYLCLKIFSTIAL